MQRYVSYLLMSLSPLSFANEDPAQNDYPAPPGYYGYAEMLKQNPIKPPSQTESLSQEQAYANIAGRNSAYVVIEPAENSPAQPQRSQPAHDPRFTSPPTDSGIDVYQSKLQQVIKKHSSRNQGPVFRPPGLESAQVQSGDTAHYSIPQPVYQEPRPPQAIAPSLPDQPVSQRPVDYPDAQVFQEQYQNASQLNFGQWGEQLPETESPQDYYPEDYSHQDYSAQDYPTGPVPEHQPMQSYPPEMNGPSMKGPLMSDRAMTRQAAPDFNQTPAYQLDYPQPNYPQPDYPQQAGPNNLPMPAADFYSAPEPSSYGFNPADMPAGLMERFMGNWGQNDWTSPPGGFVPPAEHFAVPQTPHAMPYPMDNQMIGGGMMNNGLASPGPVFGPGMGMPEEDIIYPPSYPEGY